MKRDSYTFQVQLWSLLGSWICLLSLFILWIKGRQLPFFLPLSLLFGVPLCWRWKWGGAAASTLFIFGFLFFYYPQIPLEEHFWFVGMGISIALSLWITALVFEEVEGLLEAQAVESRSRLDNLWKVDEKKKAVEEELGKNKESFRELQVKVRSYQKLVDMATEEALESRQRLQESEENQKELKDRAKLLEEKIYRISCARTENVYTNNINPLEAQYRQLREQFEEKGRVLDQTRKELFNANEKLMRFQKDIEESKVYGLREAEAILERHLVQYNKEREETEEAHRKEVETLQEIVAGFFEKEKKGEGV